MINSVGVLIDGSTFVDLLSVNLLLTKSDLKSSNQQLFYGYSWERALR